jgi:NAD(P)H dehydrogenase (quinone)
VLTLPGQAGQVYELAGDSAYTLSDFAAELSRQSGRAIAYVNLPEAGFKAALLGAGLPAPLAGLLADSDAGAAQGALFDGERQLSALIGRPTASLASLMQAALTA